MASSVLVLVLLQLGFATSVFGKPAASQPHRDAAGIDSRSRARELFLQGKTHYREGDYEGAVAAFQAAAKLHPSPLLEYNIGRCFDQLDRPLQAIPRYKAYLDSRPDAPNANEVRQRVAALERELAQDPYEDLERSPAVAGPVDTPSSRPYQAREGLGRGAEQDRTPQEESVVPPALAPRGAFRAGFAGGWSNAPGAAGGAAAGAAGASASGRPRAASTRSESTPWGPRPRQEGPVYQQWWFWAAIAGGLVIGGFVIAMAASSGGASSDRISSSETTGGLTLSF